MSSVYTHNGFSTRENVDDCGIDRESPSFVKVYAGGNMYAFSYSTLVAFNSPKTGLVVCKNYWSRTTGKHINSMVNDKSECVERDEFIRLYNEAHGMS